MKYQTVLTVLVVAFVGTSAIQFIKEAVISFAKNAAVIYCKASADKELNDKFVECLKTVPADYHDKIDEILDKRGEFCDGVNPKMDVILQEIDTCFAGFNEEMVKKITTAWEKDKEHFMNMARCVYGLQ